MTGIQFERAPNNYVIRVMKHGKCIEWFTYRDIDTMVCWFNCLPLMKYGRRITEHGKQLFRKRIASNVFKWKEEDEYMKKALRRYHIGQY